MFIWQVFCFSFVIITIIIAVNCCILSSFKWCLHYMSQAALWISASSTGNHPLLSLAPPLCPLRSFFSCCRKVVVWELSLLLLRSGRLLFLPASLILEGCWKRGRKVCHSSCNVVCESLVTWWETWRSVIVRYAADRHSDVETFCARTSFFPSSTFEQSFSFSEWFGMTRAIWGGIDAVPLLITPAGKPHFLLDKSRR